MLLRVLFAVAAPWLFLLVVGVFGPEPWTLALGIVVGVVATLGLANRLAGRLNPLGALRLGPWWFAPGAVVLGIGATILTSEIVNVALSFQDVLPDPEAADALKGQALTVMVTFWAGLTAVIIGASQRVLLVFLPATQTVVLSAFTIAFVVMWDPLLALPYGLIIVPSAWLYARTRSLPTAMAAWLPAALVFVALSLGYGPGIDGFDVVAKDRVLWQPVWFDLLGGLCIAAGAFPFLEWVSPPKRPGEAPS